MKLDERVGTLERLKFKLSPASINSYYRCPRKFQYRYLRNVKMPFVFKPALAIGGVTHKALAEFFRHRRDGLPGLTLEHYAEDYLRKESYPADRALELRAEHLPLIIEHMEHALDSLPEHSEVIEVEKAFDYRLQVPETGDSVALEARIDLVIRHDEDVYDHIDFKTGKQSGDLFQNVISRITVQNHLNIPSAKLRSVNVLTRSGEYEVVPSGRDEHRSTWQVVRGTIGNIATDDTWTPRPEPPVCRLCDFNSICDAADLGSEE